MFYHQFIQNYGTNVETLTNVLINEENQINVQIHEENDNKLKINADGLFNSLNKVPGSSILKNLLETLNEDILARLEPIYQQEGIVLKENRKLLEVISYLVKAKYYALALTLKQIVEKEENEKKENIVDLLNIENSIKLDISNEELNKIKLIEENFVKIGNLLDELANKLFDKCNGMILRNLGYKNKKMFVIELKEEMSKMIEEIDFKCKLMIFVVHKSTIKQRIICGGG